MFLHLQQMILNRIDRLFLASLNAIRWNTWFHLPASISSELAALVNLILILLASALGGVIIYGCCRYYFRGVPISQQLDASLIPAAVLATLIFYQAGPWPGLSIVLIVILGFIHFRTVIKETDDVVFVFWAVLSGIFVGAGFPLPALITDAVLTIIGIFIIGKRGTRMFYLLIIRYDPDIANQIMPVLQPLHGKIRSHFEKDGLIDLTIEVKLQHISLALVDRIAMMDGVKNAVMVSNDGN